MCSKAELFLLVDAIVLGAQLLVHPRQFGREVEAGLIALLRLLLQRHGRYVFELLGDLRPQRVNGRRRREHDLMQQFLQIAGPERPRPGQQFVHHRTQRIQVGSIGQFDRLDLLRRHVRGAAGDPFYARDLRVGHQRYPEIDDSNVAVESEHDVAGLDIAVNDSAAVRVVQRARGLVDQLDDVVDAQQVVGPAIGSQRSRAVHVLGHDVAMTVFLACIVKRQNIRVLQHADHVRFRQEHLAGNSLAILIGAGIDVVDLDRYVAPVVRIVGKIPDSRAAALQPR